MKLALLFAIVFCAGLALAKDVHQKKSAHTNVAHSKHSRAQKQRHVSSKRNLDENKMRLLNCIALKLMRQDIQQTTDDSEEQPTCPTDQITELSNECCSEQGLSSTENPDEGTDTSEPEDPDESTDASEPEDTSTDAGEETAEGGETAQKRRKLTHQKRHKARSHHAKAARAHKKKQ